jgi:hypothetical protein
MVRAACAFACVLFATGCTSTSLTNVWSSPDAAEALPFSDIVVACLFADESSRRSAEDHLTARIGSDRATPSYRLIALGDVKDTEKVQAVIEQQGFDGAIVMRLISVDKETVWVPGTVGRPG